jgi:hypothetical protein
MCYFYSYFDELLRTLSFSFGVCKKLWFAELHTGRGGFKWNKWGSIDPVLFQKLIIYIDFSVITQEILLHIAK